MSRSAKFCHSNSGIGPFEIVGANDSMDLGEHLLLVWCLHYHPACR